MKILDETGIPILSNRRRARVIINLFWIYIALCAISVISGYMEYGLLNRILAGQEISEQEASWNDIRQGIIGLAQVGILIAVIVTFLRWFRRAYANLHKLGVSYLEHSDQQAVWSFFIPFVNLVRPYRIMKEIWEETQNQICKYQKDFQINR